MNDPSQRPGIPLRRPAVPPALLIGLTVVLLVAAVFGVMQLVGGDDSDAGADSTAPPTTVPPTLAPTPANNALVQQISAFAGTLDATSCLVVELNGVPVAAHNGDAAVIPASNQKLLTAAAALHVLGAEYIFTTTVRAAAVDGGTVAGDLYLVGGGDPLLTSAQYPLAEQDVRPVINPTSLDALADGVAAAGITQVTGSVVGDGSRYDDEWYISTWPEGPEAGIRGIEGGPLDGLLVNDSRVTGDQQRSGDPNEAAAREFVQLLEARGITVGGGASSGAAPADATDVATVTSQPLPAVIAEMLTTSDNNTAEMLVKEMGLKVSGAGTTASGTAAMTAALGELGVDTTALQIVDGSGLSSQNRLTCGAVSDLLRRFQPGDAFAAGLPIAAQTGTLVDEFTDSPLTGRLIAKTGSLGNGPVDVDPPSARALSGYVPVQGGAIAFSLILNSPSVDVTEAAVYLPVWTSFAQVLAAYPAA